MKRVIFLLCYCLFYSTAYSQLQNRYVFNRFGKINGLAADAAYAIAQDKEGFMWIGTENGLQRYDGSRFLTFRHSYKDPNSIPHSSVEHLFFDKKARLWLRINGLTLGRFDTHSFRYTPVKLVIPDSMRNNLSTRFEEDDDGNLQLSIINYGIVTYNEKLNEFSASHNIVQFSDGTVASCINKDPLTGNYWVLSNKGFDSYNPKTKQFVPRSSDTIISHMNGIVSEARTIGPVGSFRDKKGRYWCHLWSFKSKDAGPTVYSYDPRNGQWVSYKRSLDEAARSYHGIESILEQRDGTIWVYGNNLFTKLNEPKAIFEDMRNESLRENSMDVAVVFNLYEDYEQNIWICSTNGLYLFNPGNQAFTNLPNKRGDGHNYTNAADDILQIKNGSILTAAWGAGLFYYDTNFNVLPNPIVPVNEKNYALSIWDLQERDNGEIWMGIQEGELRIHDQQTKITRVLKLAVFEKRTIRQVVEDPPGNMWLGTQGGLIIKCSNANWRDTSAFKLVQRVKGHIMKIVPEKNGRLWVATDRFGLYRLDAATGKILEHYDEKSPDGKRLHEAGAADIMLYNDSLLLICSGPLNILNTKTGNISFIRTEDGLPANNTICLAKDRFGFVWIGLMNGICRLSLTDRSIVSFGIADGINNSHFQPNASALLKDGRILFGTSTDLLLFNPGKLNPVKKPVPVSISGFRVFDKILMVDSLLALKKITLPYTDNAVTIDLTTHTYTQHYACMYKLEGVDKEWKNSSSLQVTYNYLAPGKYVFKTKVMIPGTKQADIITELVIDIQPPFWKTWWFYGLVIFAALILIYLADRERIKRIKSTQQLRTDIALGLHDDVNTALNNINLLSEMARMKADKDLARSKELIEQISDKSNRMIISMDDMLWGIDPSNDSMEKMILRMKEFVDALRNRHEANIEMYIDPHAAKLKVDMKIRHESFYIFKALLRCIVAQSNGGQTEITIGLQQNNLALTMLDRVKLNPNDTEILKCVEEMKAHAAGINASLSIHSGTVGSYIILLVPVKKNNYITGFISMLGRLR